MSQRVQWGLHVSTPRLGASASERDSTAITEHTILSDFQKAGGTTFSVTPNSTLALTLLDSVCGKIQSPNLSRNLDSRDA